MFLITLCPAMYLRFGTWPYNVVRILAVLLCFSFQYLEYVSFGVATAVLITWYGTTRLGERSAFNLFRRIHLELLSACDETDDDQQLAEYGPFSDEDKARLATYASISNEKLREMIDELVEFNLFMKFGYRQKNKHHPTDEIYR